MLPEVHVRNYIHGPYDMAIKTRLILLVLMYHSVLSKEIFCPGYCKCDLFGKYRRASCTNKKLISVDAEIPTETEILDLSYNLIHDLADHVFIDLNLTSLKLLNLSHNTIGQIHMNTFADMNSVKTIDLSFNNIEYLLENWFWNLPALEELYLQGNNLRKLHDEPVLESKSLKVLDISNCHLLNVHDDTFLKLENLKALDLSGNALIQLNANVIKPLHNLKTLKLENNPWNCNDIIKSLIRYLKKKNVSFKNICESSINAQEKFQRMVVEPVTTTETSRNSWIFEEDINMNSTMNCTDINDTGNNTPKGVLLEIMELSPVLALITPFLLGLGLGLIIACCVGSKSSKPKFKTKPARSQRSSIIRRRRTSDYFEYPLMQPESFEICESTPVPLRKNIFTTTSTFE